MIIPKTSGRRPARAAKSNGRRQSVINVIDNSRFLEIAA